LSSLGHPCKFQRVLRLGIVTARHSSSGRQPNFAALNRGHRLYSAGWPSRWALAHILVLLTVNLTDYFYPQFPLPLINIPLVRKPHGKQCGIHHQVPCQAALLCVPTCSATANEAHPESLHSTNTRMKMHNAVFENGPWLYWQLRQYDTFTFPFTAKYWST